jgi:hypothetical protein
MDLKNKEMKGWLLFGFLIVEEPWFELQSNFGIET